MLRSIARIRKQIFSIVAATGCVTVSAATVIGRGFDTYQLFLNATIAILVFGFIGYLLGLLYNWLIEQPLLESYREEARQRVEALKNTGQQRVSMEIAVSELEPGMKAVETIHNQDGALLVRSGAVINNRMIKLLRENGIQKIKIEGQRSVSTEDAIARQMEGV